MTEDEMVGWHHRLDGHEFGWTPGVGAFLEINSGSGSAFDFLPKIINLICSMAGIQTTSLYCKNNNTPS